MRLLLIFRKENRKNSPLLIKSRRFTQSRKKKSSCRPYFDRTGAHFFSHRHIVIIRILDLIEIQWFCFMYYCGTPYTAPHFTEAMGFCSYVHRNALSPIPRKKKKRLQKGKTLFTPICVPCLRTSAMFLDYIYNIYNTTKACLP